MKTEIELGGDTTFTPGIVEAIGDFSDSEQFQERINTIIVITGSGDSCTPELAARILSEQMQKVGRRIIIRIIGLGLPPEQQAALDEAVRAMGGQTFFVKTLVELEDALGTIIAELQEARRRFAQGDETFQLTPVPILEQVQPPIPPGTATPIPTTIPVPTPETADDGDGRAPEVVPSLEILPLPEFVAPGEIQPIGATGGIPSYTFSIAENNSGSSIDPDSGEYTAGSIGGVTDTLAVADQSGNVVQATVDVLGPLVILPLPEFVASDSTQIIEATGGILPYIFSIVENNSGGSIDPDTGEYTAGSISDVTDIIEVRDGRGISTQVAVQVVAAPIILLEEIVAPGEIQIIQATGGIPSYTYSIIENNSGASINPITGQYIAGPTSGVTDVVGVIDERGISTQATVAVVAPPTPQEPPPADDDDDGDDEPTVTPTTASNPPTVNPQTFSVDENSANGTPVGTVAASDPDVGDITFAVTGSAAFSIIDDSSGQITVADISQLDFEAFEGTPNFTLEAQVTDSDGLTDSATITINLNDLNEAPVITSAAAVDAAENQTAVIDVQSTDPEGETEGGGGLIYSLTGVVDDGLFSIDTNTGVLTFIAAPDFEAFADFDEDNVYEVQVTVTDSGLLTDVQDIAVTVTDVGEE